MTYSLQAPERETIVTTDDDASEVRVWTAQKRYITKLRADSAWTEIRSGHIGTTEWAEFTIPADRWSPSGVKRTRKMSEAARKAASERITKAQLTRRQSGPEAWQGAPTYRAAHQRVRTARGSAKHHPCVDCGRPAAAWSYNHRDPKELQGGSSGLIFYSEDPAQYDPRCTSCHNIFDSAEARARKRAEERVLENAVNEDDTRKVSASAKEQAAARLSAHRAGDRSENPLNREAS